MRSNPRAKMSIGAAIACIAALAVALAPILNYGDLPRPWSFLVGFATGVCLGIGAALSIGGLIEYRRQR